MISNDAPPSLQFIEAMKRTAVSVEGEDMWGFRRGLSRVVCHARITKDGDKIVVVSDVTTGNVEGGAPFAFGFLNILSDIFDVTIVADLSKFDDYAKDAVEALKFYKDEATGLFVRVPRSIGRLAA